MKRTISILLLLSTTQGCSFFERSKKKMVEDMISPIVRFSTAYMIRIKRCIDKQLIKLPVLNFSASIENSKDKLLIKNYSYTLKGSELESKENIEGCFLSSKSNLNSKFTLTSYEEQAKRVLRDRENINFQLKSDLYPELKANIVSIDGKMKFDVKVNNISSITKKE